MAVKEARIQEIGAELFDRIKANKPSVFDTGRWSGQILEWAMRDPEFKTEMFRFVDVFPVLATPDAVSKHITEYLLRPGLQVPAAIKLALKGAGLTGFTARLASAQIAKNMTKMAGRFIAGTDGPDALQTLKTLWDSGQAFTVDKLGEATVSGAEAEAYAESYLKLLNDLVSGTHPWQPNGVLETDASGPVSRVNLSVKASAMCSQFHSLASEVALPIALRRLTPLMTRAREAGAFINLDMEQRASKDLVLELFRRVLIQPEFDGFESAGVVIQAYLNDAEADLDALIRWAKKHGRRITVRLVKGAYWDYETVRAMQEGWPSPVWRHKAETDACFERMTRTLMKNNRYVRVAIGSHNVRSIAVALAEAEAHRVPPADVEFQSLYGMAEPIRAALVDSGHRVRVYAPVGELIPGMAYLVRRLLENTSNSSWLRLGFAEGKGANELLAAPIVPTAVAAPPSDVFVNEPLRDFGIPQVRQQFSACLSQPLGLDVMPIIAGTRSPGIEQERRFSPSDPSTRVATVDYASVDQLNEAIESAHQGFESWSATAPATRATALVTLAQLMRNERDALATLMCHESGKPWSEADGDVCEAIDFCEYYAREMLRLADPSLTQAVAGERSELSYVARGVCGVIAPWNFPLAILAGMTTAALVTGNTVVAKPAEQSSAIAFRFVELAHQAGIPTDALHLVTGRGESVGAALVRHPHVTTVAFTGSKAVGLDIWAAAAQTDPSQTHLRRVVCEMGGKNGIIVDDDADLDDAVLGVIHSAFGFAGQKCSACSRVIVLSDIYDVFTTRLVEAARSLFVGPAHEPQTAVGPVIDQESHERILRVIAGARLRVPVLLAGDWKGPGFVVPPTIFGPVPADDPLATDEIFGPVLAVIRADNFDQALTTLADTRYALTGGLFSRSPANIEQAKRTLKLGNLYINRSIT
ncbi:MAG: RHH-type proline utilization regulon transcriptional repressor/proline dehydrogenase, partial [Myxococcota bacterium]